jgi:hypothetical protein
MGNGMRVADGGAQTQTIPYATQSVHLQCDALPVIFMLNLSLGGSLRHAVSAGLLSFIFVSSVSFMTCANEVNKRYMNRQAFKRALQEQQMEKLPDTLRTP